MKKIIAKFSSNCAETGKRLPKGSPIYYDYSTRKAYHPDADMVKKWENKQEQEYNPDAWISQALEDAYCR